MPYINHKYGKSGSIWEGRYKACLLQGDVYFLTVMRRIREASQTVRPLGNDIFRDKIEELLQCKVGQARRGRPKKTTD